MTAYDVIRGCEMIKGAPHKDLIYRQARVRRWLRSAATAGVRTAGVFPQLDAAEAHLDRVIQEAKERENFST